MKATPILFLWWTLFSIPIAAQNKPQFTPYSPETSLIKLQKDYPFIKSIAPLDTALYSAEKDIVYKTVNQTALQLDIYAPKIKKDAILPAVLLVHGGGWASGSRVNQQRMAEALTQHGYIGIPVSYRLSEVAKYPAAVLDIKDAIRWLRIHAETYAINPNQIAILGASAGAQLASLIAVTPNKTNFNPLANTVSDAIQALVNVDGIVSFVHPEAEEGAVAAYWLGGSKTSAAALWKAASPLEYVDDNSPPTLFINSAQPRFHAGRDDMIKILNTHQIYNEVHTLGASPHSFWLHQPWFDNSVALTTQFLDRIFHPSNTPKAVPYRTLHVSQDGSGDFTSLQAAINSTRDLGPGEVVIRISKGIYNEKIIIPSWKHQLSLIGEDRKETIITYDDYSGKVDEASGSQLNTFTSYTLLVQGQDIKIKNLTIENRSCNQGQAVALHVEGDRFVLADADLLGCQDTLYTAHPESRQYYRNCYIEGTTDFIFGQATVLFQDCTLHSMKNSFITAAATPQGKDFGYVFMDCKLTAAEGIDEVYLGRPWRSHAKTVFINCRMEGHIVPVGWDPWKGDRMFPEKEKTVFYAEYHCTGPGAAPNRRAAWTHQLTEEQIKYYNLGAIFQSHNNWFPSEAQ